MDESSCVHKATRILLTVPHLESTASPYREMMAVARYLPKPEFSLTVCSLRENGRQDTEPKLRALGADVFVSRFRLRGRKRGHVQSLLRDQRNIAQRGPFDVQHSLDFSSTPVEAMLARRWGRRFVFTQRSLNEAGHPALLWSKCALSHRIVAISGAVRDMLCSLPISRRKIVEIALGIDTIEEPASLAEALPVQGPFVLCVGHIAPRKRSADAIEAFARIASSTPNLSLVIAGGVVDADYSREIHQLVQDRGLTSRVHFLGVRADVFAIMGRASCLLHCAESEAFGWVLLEAMAAGLPVVASSVGGIKEVIENERTGLLVAPGDVEGFAAALRRILANPDMGRAIVHEGARVVRERFSASKMVSRLTDVYRSVRARRSSRRF